MIVYRKSDGKFLLVHKPRAHHAWQFPQGGIDPGEDYRKAAQRELEEELGTNSFRSYYKSEHVYFYPFSSDEQREKKVVGNKQSYCLVEFTGNNDDLHLNRDELDDYRWVYQNEFPEYLESPDYLKKVNQVIYEFRKHL